MSGAVSAGRPRTRIRYHSLRRAMNIPQRRYWTPNASTRPGAVHVARSASVMSQRLPNERCCEDGLRRRHRHRFVAPLAGIVPGAEAAAPSSVSSSTSTAKLFLHSSPSSRRSAHPQTWLHRRSASKRSSRPTTRPPHRRCAERRLTEPVRSSAETRRWALPHSGGPQDSIDAGYLPSWPRTAPSRKPALSTLT